MRANTFAAVLSITFASMLAHSAEPTSPTAATKAPASTKVAISLQTMDAKGSPLDGVTVRGFQTDKKGPVTPFSPEFSGITDEQGRWHAELPFGEYMVLATKDNLVASSGTWWNLSKKELKADVKLTLVEGATVRATVIDAATLKPIPGAQVILDCGHAVTADESGIAVLTAVPTAERTLKAMLPPFGDAHVAFNPTGRPLTTVEVQLGPGYEVRGRVTNSDGLPVKGAVVEDNYSGETFLVQMNVCATDDDGNYQLGWYTKSRPLWSLSVTHKDYADQSRSELPPPAEGTVARCDFVLDRGMEISGTVNDEERKPIKGASVRYGGSWSLIGLRWARSDEKGKFRISKIGRNESRTIVAEAQGYAPEWTKATPGKGDMVPRLEFVMQKGLTVQGRVVDRAGKPVGGVTISPRMKIDRLDEYVGGRIGVDEKGHFEITSLPESGTSLDLYGTGVSDVRRLAFDPKQPLVVTVDKPGVIMGRVIDADTRQPVKKFNVRLGFPMEPKAADEPSASYSAHLGDRGQNCEAEDGRFVIEELITRAGHAIYITAEGYTQSYTDKVVAAPADDPSWPREFILDGGEMILGRLTDAVSGEAIGGAKVYYVDTEEWHGGQIRANHLKDLRRMRDYRDVMVVISDPSGAVELHLPRGRRLYSAVVAAPGYAPMLLERQSVTDGSFKVPPLPREAKINATVAGVTGLDAANDGISIQTPTYCPDRVILKPDGTFEVAGLPPGKAIVSVTDRSGSIRGSALLDLKAGETTSFDLVKQSAATVRVVVTRNGTPLEGADVRAKLDGWPKSIFAQVGTGTTGKDGMVTLEHLPLGKCTIDCFGAGLRQSHPIDLTDLRQTPNVLVDLSDPVPAKK